MECGKEDKTVGGELQIILYTDLLVIRMHFDTTKKVKYER